nr:CD3324 family protein [uncultured Niameybacter sp.]
MKHIKAEQVLPLDLVKEIQKYIKGQYIYIPNEEGRKKAWGEKNGSKAQLQIRNNEIREKYRSGYKVEELCSIYYLSQASIKKIIYGSKRDTT